MAKDRHRIFEIYPEHDEAAWEVMPKGKAPVELPAPIDTSSFKHLVVSWLAGVTQVQFTAAEFTQDEIIGELKNEFGQLGEKLSPNSRLLIDFTGVQSIRSDVVQFLATFNQRLQVRGSRMVLCCLQPTVRESFFPER